MDKKQIDIREATGVAAGIAWAKVCSLKGGTSEYEAAVDSWLVLYNEWRQACDLPAKSREDAINGKGR